MSASLTDALSVGVAPRPGTVDASLHPIRVMLHQVRKRTIATTDQEVLTVSQYKTLRSWSLILIVLGVLSIISAVIGVIVWAEQVDGAASTLAVLLFGGPVAILLATWPIALGQALRAIADIGDAVATPGTFDRSRV